MRDYPLQARPPFSPTEECRFATVALRLIEGGFVLQILAGPKTASDQVSTALQTVTEGEAQIYPLSPGQWFVMGSEELQPERLEEIRMALAGLAEVSDQSHGRVRIRIWGENVRKVLAKGAMVDLDTCRFPIGHSAMTMIGHIGALISKVGEDCFDLVVLRSFSESLWRDLCEMAK